MKYTILFLAILCLTTQTTTAQWSSDRPDGHAPIQVMGDHTHSKGEFMFSYRFMTMNMNGNGNGTSKLNNSEILISGTGNYMVTPVKMPMDMHMFGGMYAFTDNLTSMVMISYLDNSMDHLTAMGGRFTTQSSGLSDLKLGVLYKIYDEKNSRVHWNFGLSIPTGSIENKDVTPASGGSEVILPYPMQIGSGSFDFLPGITYLAQRGNLSYGLQAKGVVRLNDNSNNYRLGNRYEATSWFGLNIADVVSPLLSFKFSTWDNIRGANPDLNPNMIHTADPNLKSGSRLDLGLGINLQGPSGALRDFRIAANYDLPIYQNLNGPQMWTESIFTVGLQYVIH